MIISEVMIIGAKVSNHGVDKYYIYFGSSVMNNPELTYEMKKAVRKINRCFTTSFLNPITFVDNLITKNEILLSIPITIPRTLGASVPPPKIVK